MHQMLLINSLKYVECSLLFNYNSMLVITRKKLVMWADRRLNSNEVSFPANRMCVKVKYANETQVGEHVRSFIYTKKSQQKSMC